MTISWIVRLMLCLTVVTTMGSLSGCQSNGTKDESKMVPAAQIPFYPQVSRVGVRAGEGNYPNLFSGATYAVWGGAAMMDTGAMKAATEPSMGEKMEAEPIEGSADSTGEASSEMTTVEKESPDARAVAPAIAPTRSPGQPLVIDCFLESEFPDMSIAYDAVGLRGVDFFLALPGGGEILPVQKTLDSNLSEIPVGALRKFGRKVTLYFPAETIIVDNPAVNPGSEGVRLVFEAHNTRFYFEWPATPDFTPRTRKPRMDKKALKAGSAVYQDVSSTAKKVSHEFD